MQEYNGYEIQVIKNNEREYPYKAIARKGDDEIKHKGRSVSEAVDFVKQGINIITSRINKSELN